MMTPRSGVLLIALVLLPALPAGAWASLIPCAKTASSDKVYLDDVRAHDPDEAVPLDTLMHRVAFKVEANLEDVEVRSQRLVQVLGCTARFPAGDADFTPTLCRTLVSEKVLLEVWSEVRHSVNDDGDEIVVVDLLVAIMPLLANPEPGAPAGVRRFVRRCPPGATLRQVLRAIDAKDELWGLAKLAAGIRESGLGHDSQAVAALCDAVRALRGIADPARRAECAPLADYADRLAGAARTRLQASGALPDFVTEAATCEVTP